MGDTFVPLPTCSRCRHWCILPGSSSETECGVCIGLHNCVELAVSGNIPLFAQIQVQNSINFLLGGFQSLATATPVSANAWADSRPIRPAAGNTAASLPAGSTAGVATHPVERSVSRTPAPLKGSVIAATTASSKSAPAGEKWVPTLRPAQLLPRRRGEYGQTATREAEQRVPEPAVAKSQVPLRQSPGEKAPLCPEYLDTRVRTRRQRESSVSTELSSTEDSQGNYLGHCRVTRREKGDLLWKKQQLAANRSRASSKGQDFSAVPPPSEPSNRFATGANRVPLNRQRAEVQPLGTSRSSRRPSPRSYSPQRGDRRRRQKTSKGVKKREKDQLYRDFYSGKSKVHPKEILNARKKDAGRTGHEGPEKREGENVPETRGAAEQENTGSGQGPVVEARSEREDHA